MERIPPGAVQLERFPMAKPKVVMVLANNFEDSEAIEPKNHLEARGADVVTVGAEMVVNDITVPTAVPSLLEARAQ